MTMPSDHNPPLTAFFLLKTTAAWLAQSPAERDDFVTKVLRPILARHPTVQLRYFDAEAYCARTTDVLMWSFEKTSEYHALVEELRETAFWGPYFKVRQILVCTEDGFARHYGFAGFGSPAAAASP